MTVLAVEDRLQQEQLTDKENIELDAEDVLDTGDALGLVLALHCHFLRPIALGAELDAVGRF